MITMQTRRQSKNLYAAAAYIRKNYFSPLLIYLNLNNAVRYLNTEASEKSRLCLKTDKLLQGYNYIPTKSGTLCK